MSGNKDKHRSSRGSSSNSHCHSSNSNPCRGCGDCDCFVPIPCPPPTRMCCFKKICAKYCCGKCKHEGTIILKMPTFANVYFTGKIVADLPLTAGIATPVIYTHVVANSTMSVGQVNSYNGITGNFTIPQCGDGFYNLSVHTAVTTTATAGTLTIGLVVNGQIAAQNLINITAAGTIDLDLTFGVPMTYNQTVSVIATASTAGTVLNGIASTSTTSLSLVRSSDL